MKVRCSTFCFRFKYLINSCLMTRALLKISLGLVRGLGGVSETHGYDAEAVA
jgi:hypothetical protein